MTTFQDNLKSVFFLSVLVALLIVTDGCKKNDAEDPSIPPQTTPVFTMSHILISVGGKDYIQFISCCTSENVKLVTATITDPGNKRFYYEYYSDTADYLVFIKNEAFTFPEDYSRQPGIWKFTFFGQRYKDNSDFTSVVNDTIPD